VEIGATDVSADAVSSNPHALPAEFAGGQVARGSQMGVLGNQDNMDVPFTATSYTSKLIEDQQAEDVGDVLLNDPAVRQSFGFGNQAQVFVIRGLPLASDEISTMACTAFCRGRSFPLTPSSAWKSSKVRMPLSTA
jgi:iron complex outermembrane receptor protein